MAHVRATLERFTDTSVKANIQQEFSNTAKQELRKAETINPYATPLGAADALEAMGIMTNPYAIKVHSHGPAKAVENRILEVLGCKLPNEPVTFMFLKTCKRNQMRRNPRIPDVFMNQTLEPRDCSRYDPTTVVDKLYRIETRVAYISDALHFYKPSFVANLFKHNPELDLLYASLVLPAEALHKHASLHPEIYTINYNYDGFQYIPGNHAGGAYHHSFDTLEWLKYGWIEWEDYRRGADGFPKPFRVNTITVQMEEALGANMLFSFKRGDMLTPLVRTFHVDEMVTFPQIFHPQQMNVSRPFPKVLAMKLYLYIKSIKAVTERDIYAKIRQLVVDSDLRIYDPAEVTHLANYYYFITKLPSLTTYDDILSCSLVGKAWVPIKAAIKKIWQSIAGPDPFTQLLKALQWNTFTYAVKVERRRTILRPSEQQVTWKEDPRDRFYQSEFLEPDEEEDKDDTDTGRATAHIPIGPRPGLRKRKQNESGQETRQVWAPKERILPTAPPLTLNKTQNTTEFHTITCKCSADLVVDKMKYEGAVELNAPDQVKTRRVGFYSRTEGEEYHYTGGHHKSLGWPVVLDELLDSLGFSGQFDHCLYQEYEDKSHIPYHADDEPCYPEDVQILTCNLRGRAKFGVSCKQGHVEFKLEAGDYFLMPPGFQRTHKHSVTALTDGRVSMTFRNSKKMVELKSTQPEELGTVDEDPMTVADYEAILNRVGAPTPGMERTHDASTSASTPTKETSKQGVHQLLHSEPEHNRHEDHGRELADQDVKDPWVDVPWRLWREIIEQLGFKGWHKQHDAQGNLIYPITDTHRLPKEPFPKDVPIPLQDLLRRLNRTPVTITYDNARAQAYAGDVKYGKTGKLLTQQPLQWKESLVLSTEKNEIKKPTVIIHGAGGSGKSKALQDWMRTISGRRVGVTVILPTNELRNDWIDKIPLLESRVFKTFERGLMQGASDVVIFDDYTKLPKGYIEAYLAHQFMVRLVILTGDPRQSEHHETHADSASGVLEPATTVLKPYCRYYINATHRNNRDIANALGVYSERFNKSAITMSSQLMPGIPLLCPSMIKKESLADMGQRAMTYAGCQGLTAPKVQILLDSNTPLCSDQVVYTALSRAVEQIHFINTGPTSSDFWRKMDCTPYLKTFLDTVREEQFRKIEEVDVEPEEPEVRTHFPVDTALPILEAMADAQGDKHSREIYNKQKGYSNAIQTEDPVVQLFQHQQAKDETLYWATIDKRLRFTTPEENEKEFLLKKDVGDVLFYNYAQAMGLPNEPIPFEPDLWERCRQEVERTYLAKPVSALMNGELRQSPDFDKHKIALFLKSQWVTKVEKMGTEVKPGQTIASFMQETVMVYGTMARYMRHMRKRFQPPNIYIHCEKSDADMSNFVTCQWNFGRKACSNDYTAFDQSQDGAMLQFEVLKAKHHNVPEDVIESYIKIKTCAKVFLGTLAIMRLSGEGPTFDANTECSIAYVHAKYHVPREAVQLYAGDDSAMDCVCALKPSFAMIQEKLKLEEKLVVHKQSKGDWAGFCGNIITPQGVFKDPLKLYAGWELAKRKPHGLERVKVSYTLDARKAYGLGDALQEVLTEEQCRAHYALIREIHINHLQHLLQ